MNPKYLCYRKNNLLLERCHSCYATNSCGLYESDVDPFNIYRQEGYLKRGIGQRKSDRVVTSHSVGNHSQQPKVIACQGEEEMFKTLSEKNESCKEVAHLTRNSSADTYLRSIK